MPINWVQTKQRIIRPQPEHIDRPIVERQIAALRPDVRREVIEDEMAGLYPRVIDDLPKIVVREFEERRLKIDSDAD